MSVLGIDLGGTKLAVAVFTETGELLSRESIPLDKIEGEEVGALITDQVKKYLTNSGGSPVRSIGICVPGISRSKTGTVWAPNIPGWNDYPLLAEVKAVAKDIPVTIDSDRACYILGENWQGSAKGCSDAIYLAIGTGIGAGILVNGTILRGAHDIAGAIGWLALNKPFRKKYIACGCFEHYASGEGIAKVARDILDEILDYDGELAQLSTVTAADIFVAYENKDKVAVEVITQCIEFWGMAVANLVSLFNPEKVIIGGGVFGPGVKFIPEIKREASRWAQPISVMQVSIEASELDGDAGVYGAGFLALKNINL